MFSCVRSHASFFRTCLYRFMVWRSDTSNVYKGSITLAIADWIAIMIGDWRLQPIRAKHLLVIEP